MLDICSLFDKETKLKKRNAIAILLLSVCIFTGMPTAAFFLWKCIEVYHQKNPAFFITSLLQTSHGVDNLKTPYLAQMLRLSGDKPINIYAFDTSEYEKKLSCYPMIEWAKIKVVKPSTLFIHYQLREPIALVGNFTNTAIDKEGVLFPLDPFYTPKHLPEAIFGEDHFSDMLENDDSIWGKTLPKKKVELVARILEQLPGRKIQRVDVSKINAPSYGQREIVLVLKNKTVLRLSTKNYQEELRKFTLLAEHKPHFFNKKAVVVDLRIPEVAYLYPLD